MQFLSILFVCSICERQKKRKKSSVYLCSYHYVRAVSMCTTVGTPVHSFIRVGLTTTSVVFLILFYWSFKETLLYKINTQELWPHELLHIIYMQIYLFELECFDGSIKRDVYFLSVCLVLLSSFFRYLRFEYSVRKKIVRCFTFLVYTKEVVTLKQQTE